MGAGRERKTHAFSLWPRPTTPTANMPLSSFHSRPASSTETGTSVQDFHTKERSGQQPIFSIPVTPTSDVSSSGRFTRAGGILGLKTGSSRKAVLQAAQEQQQPQQQQQQQQPQQQQSLSSVERPVGGLARTALQPRSISADSTETVTLPDSSVVSPSIAPVYAPPRPPPAAMPLSGPPPSSAGHGTTARSSTSQRNDRTRFSSTDSSVTTGNSRDRENSTVGSVETYETDATSIHTLPPLQAKGPGYELGQLEMIAEDDPTSYDLLAPNTSSASKATSYSLERRGEEMFSTEHLRAIFDDPASLLKFTSFLGSHRPESVPILIYYLDALKALRAVRYANAVSEALEPLEGHSFTKAVPPSTRNPVLEEKAHLAFQAMVEEDLPAFVTHVWIGVVSASIHRRITGTLPPHLREASEGLAEVFCLSDPSRPDNPIVFASEEFHRVTQYGNSYAMGRNCRFLQGPRTNRNSIRRLRQACEAGKEHCEVFVNYRRDGSPFMNLLMTAPLRDSRGTLRYYIGAQVDVSGLAKECAELEALQKMLGGPDSYSQYADNEENKKDEFQELSEMLNISELEIVRKYGGRMHHEHAEENEDTGATWHRPRLLLKDPSAERIDDGAHNHHTHSIEQSPPLRQTVHGKLSGVYQHYLLVRPFPSLRILFASPSLRVPGILQSPFMSRIGGSTRVRDELVAALAEGRGVTAKIRWISRAEDEGRNRWVHCTPLMGSNGSIGVWMIVLVDDESSRAVRRFRPAPPVAQEIGGKVYRGGQGQPSAGGESARGGERSGTAMSGRYSRQDGSFDFTLH